MLEHRRGYGNWLRGAGALMVCVLATLGLAPFATAGEEPFPERRPATRVEAAAVLSNESGQPFLTSRIEAARRTAAGRNEATLRALRILLQSPVLPSEWLTPEGIRIRYTTADGAVDRIAATDEDRDGVPDILDATAKGLRQAHGLLIERMQFPAPAGVEVALVPLGGEAGGYLIPDDRREGGFVLVLDAAPQASLEGIRRAAIRQYAHAVARMVGPRFPVTWSEALAHWAELAVEGQPDSRLAALISRRLQRLDAGLFVDDLGLAAGNAVWLAYLEQAHGPVAVRLTIEELGRGGAEPAALDRALRRSSGQNLASAFREFHLWSVLVGDRAGPFHFSFADKLTRPGFASVNEALPALSVQADPPVADWGASQVLIQAEAADGGLRVRFEGEFTARWEADLLLVGGDGTLRRLPIELPDGRGEITVPLGSLAETLLLVRNLGSDDRAPRRYTYAAHRERGYPFEIVSLDAVEGESGRGVKVIWETASEQALIGYNVLRLREEGGQPTTVNPIWIPALGDESNSTWYSYIDQTAEPGVAYVYRIEGITGQGLTSLSDRVSVRPRNPRRDP